MIDPLTVSHPNGDYFSTTLDQAKWRDDVWGNQYVLLKDYTGINSIYDKRNTTGEVWVKTPANKIYPISEFFSTCFQKYIGNLEYLSLSSNTIKDFEIFYDTILVKCKTDNSGDISIVEKFSYDYENDSILKLNGSKISLTSDYGLNYWFNEKSNEIYLINLIDNNTIYPIIKKIDISTNNINIKNEYINSDISSLSASEILGGLSSSSFTDFETCIHTSDNKSYIYEVLGKKTNTIDFITYTIVPQDGTSDISVNWIQGLVPTETQNLSAVDWYVTSLSATLTLSGTVGDEILFDLSNYPHDGYGTSEVIYDFDDSTKVIKETQNDYFYDPTLLTVSHFYYEGDDPTVRPIKHTFTKAGTYSIKIDITNAGTLRKESLEKNIVISNVNYYNIFDDIHLIDCRETRDGKTYALETTSPNYITFLNITDNN